MLLADPNYLKGPTFGDMEAATCMCTRFNTGVQSHLGGGSN